MKTKNIQHTVLIRARPGEVYDAMMNGKKHAQFTGARARIRPEAQSLEASPSVMPYRVEIVSKPRVCGMDNRMAIRSCKRTGFGASRPVRGNTNSLL